MTAVSIRYKQLLFVAFLQLELIFVRLVCVVTFVGYGDFELHVFAVILCIVCCAACQALICISITVAECYKSDTHSAHFSVLAYHWHHWYECQRWL